MLAYCDYIMHRIREELIIASSESSAPVPITKVGKTEWDLDEGGAFKSTTKRLTVMIGNKAYRITVEEA